jgi:Protein of unknown function (DUF1604)
MAERPRYVPSKNRRKKQDQERFHGAFTGGFSAGFFNSVGSKEGWKPRSNEDDYDVDDHNDTTNNKDEEGNIVAQDYYGPGTSTSSGGKKRPRPIQKLDDFMDEQDHDDWGGPTSLRKEYKDPTPATAVNADNNDGTASIGNWMKAAIVVPPANVGNRLLRVLGWREGNLAAYVPATELEQESQSSSLLSKKRLRKVQLQQKRVQIPPPKLDTCGLGYEPYQNAPEFRAHQEKRRKQAKERAQLKTNVYRVSSVIGNTSDGIGNDSRYRQSTNENSQDDDHDAYVSYETVEDFVGHKSVGGFALREDADDAYDDDQPLAFTKGSDKVRVNQEAYHTEVYDHASSDDENDTPAGIQKRSLAGSNTATTNRNENKLAGVLSSFADTGTGIGSAATQKSNANVFTTDGRPPLPGFVMGGAFSSHMTPKRYRGPDVPSNYEVIRREFGPNELPSVLKALSHAVQLEVVDQKRRQVMDEALRINASSNRPSRQLFQSKISNNTPKFLEHRSNAPMAGGAFSGLAVAMKSRFTSVTETPHSTQLESGLRQPSKDKVEDTKQYEIANEGISQSNASEIKITRTMHPFVPHRLLCKRFHVPVPLASSAQHAPGLGRVTEASYFEQEILNPATLNKRDDKAEKKEPATTSNCSLSRAVFDEDGVLKDEALGSITIESPGAETRPSMETYKSIFEPKSEDETDLDSDGEEKERNNDSSTSDVAPNLRWELEATGKAKRGTTSANIPLEEEKADSDEVPAISEAAATDGKKSCVTSIVPYSERAKKKKAKKQKSRKRDRKSRRANSDTDSEGSQRRMKRSRSVSSDSTDLSRDSRSTDDHRDRNRRRERKGKKRTHKHKTKKKSKRN